MEYGKINELKLFYDFDFDNYEINEETLIDYYDEIDNDIKENCGFFYITVVDKNTNKKVFFVSDGNTYNLWEL